MLSFGEAEEVPEVPLKKGISRKDLEEVAPPPPPKAESSRKAETFVDLPASVKDLPKAAKPVDLKAIRAQHAKEKAQDR